MTTILHYPHSLNTKYYAILLYTNGNSNISLCELYGKLRVEKGDSKHACSLFRIVKNLKLLF